jgi:hypothetical protein
MNLTDEQTAIIEAARETRDNLAIIARAGCGKTFTLTQIAEVLPREDILCIAFNKAIAEEMRRHLPDNCESKTLHAIGYKAWWGFIRRKTSVSGGKIYTIMSEIIKSYEDELDADELAELWEDFADMMKAVSSGKMAGWLPEQFEGHWRPLVGDVDFFDSLDREYSPIQQDIIKTTSVESFKSALHEGRLDFDDMIFCPAICAVQWPSPSLTLVDEAQDLAPINHHIIRKIVRRSRIIAVGDPCQPLGTMITKVIKKGDRWNEPILKQVPIEDIQIGDTILGHNANGSFMYNRKVQGITRKPFSGNLVVAGPTRYTPNHHCYTRFASLANHWCIYLMQKGDAYRIGKARMSYGEQGLGPQIRAKAEGADAMWILSTFENETDAFIAEAVIQTEFGLSDLCFVDSNRPWLSSFWNEMKTLNLEARARACLEAYHREYNYPLWTPGDSIPSKRPFITRACNLLDGCELLPYREAKLTGKDSWESYSIAHETYDGDVISFTISDNHLYVADNIVTHNCQAIYGFRGADVRSMERMIDIFSMRKLPLTLTFRCPAEIVRNVHWRADDMRWSRDGGTVLRPITWRPEDLQLNDAIICRNNAPLFRMAIRLITASLLPEIAGRDIGAPLVKIMEKLSRNKKIVNKESHRLLLEWRDKQLSKARDGAAQSIHDRYECISIMLDQTETLGDAIAYLQHLLARDGRIRLMTGHKAKGLEFPRVFFLDQQLCNPKYEQDLNLRYVVETRAQDTLIYVTSESFITEEADEMS